MLMRYIIKYRMDYNAEMKSSGDKDELSEKEKKNQK